MTEDDEMGGPSGGSGKFTADHPSLLEAVQLFADLGATPNDGATVEELLHDSEKFEVVENKKKKKGQQYATLTRSLSTPESLSSSLPMGPIDPLPTHFRERSVLSSSSTSAPDSAESMRLSEPAPAIAAVSGEAGAQKKDGGDGGALAAAQGAAVVVDNWQNAPTNSPPDDVRRNSGTERVDSVVGNADVANDNDDEGGWQVIGRRRNTFPREGEEKPKEKDNPQRRALTPSASGRNTVADRGGSATQERGHVKNSPPGGWYGTPCVHGKCGVCQHCLSQKDHQYNPATSSNLKTGQQHYSSKPKSGPASSSNTFAISSSSAGSGNPPSAPLNFRAVALASGLNGTAVGKPSQPPQSQSLPTATGPKENPWKLPITQPSPAQPHPLSDASLQGRSTQPPPQPPSATLPQAHPQQLLFSNGALGEVGGDGAGVKRSVDTQALDADIELFVRQCALSPEVRMQIDDVVAELRSIVSDCWEAATVEVFGSFATDMFMPHSDLDLVVFGAPEGPSMIGDNMRVLRERLNSKRWRDVKILERTAVPVMKIDAVLLDRRLPIDITFHGPFFVYCVHLLFVPSHSFVEKYITHFFSATLCSWRVWESSGDGGEEPRPQTHRDHTQSAQTNHRAQVVSPCSRAQQSLHWRSWQFFTYSDAFLLLSLAPSPPPPVSRCRSHPISLVFWIFRFFQVPSVVAREGGATYNGDARSVSRGALDRVSSAGGPQCCQRHFRNVESPGFT